MIKFLTVDLEAARIFVDLACSSANRSVSSRYIEHAREAYDTVQHFCGRLSLTRPQRDDVQGKLSYLKLSLEAAVQRFHEFAHTFPRFEDFPSRLEPTTLPGNVKRFLLSCRRLRDEASRMLALNHQLMKRRARFATAPLIKRPMPDIAPLPHRATKP